MARSLEQPEAQLSGVEPDGLVIFVDHSGDVHDGLLRRGAPFGVGPVLPGLGGRGSHRVRWDVAGPLASPNLMNFSDFSLHPKLLRAVEQMGYTQPTPIQTQAIPPALIPTNKPSSFARRRASGKPCSS